jgi:hypothetical protein
MWHKEFNDVVYDFIAFINQQVGVYVDACAGFSGNCVRVERQVFRIQKRVDKKIGPDGQPIMVMASFENPTQPDVIHHRIIRADEFIHVNSEGGSNEQQLIQNVLVCLYTHWEDEIRPRLAAIKGVDKSEIKLDIVGDLRLIRNIILHAKGIVREDKHQEFKKIKDMFTVDQKIVLTNDNVHQIFVRLKQGAAEMIYSFYGIDDSPAPADKIKDIAIQRK